MSSPSSTQSTFYNQLASPAQIGSLFDSTPGILYFVKDLEGRFISVNQPNLKWLGLKSETHLVGRNDNDFFPPEMAEKFIRGDQKVLSTGLPLNDDPELIVGADGTQKWFLTSKKPLSNRRGQVIGIAGITQSREDLPAHAKAHAEISPVVEFIRQNQHRVISISEMTKLAASSERQLYRKFKEAFNTTPLRFSLLTRLRSVRSELSESRTSIIELAQKYGFCDQSALTRAFTKQNGLTPSEYRKQFQK